MCEELLSVLFCFEEENGNSTDGILRCLNFIMKGKYEWYAYLLFLSVYCL